jgi:hypothetical protein
MSGAGPTGGRRRWRVRFETTGAAVTLQLQYREGNDADRDAILDLFRQRMRDTLGRGGCGAFTVSIHVDGPDCDHETGGRGGNAA